MQCGEGKCGSLCVDLCGLGQKCSCCCCCCSRNAAGRRCWDDVTSSPTNYGKLPYVPVVWLFGPYVDMENGNAVRVDLNPAGHETGLKKHHILLGDTAICDKKVKDYMDVNRPTSGTEAEQEAAMKMATATTGVKLPITPDPCSCGCLNWRCPTVLCGTRVPCCGGADVFSKCRGGCNEMCYLCLCFPFPHNSKKTDGIDSVLTWGNQYENLNLLDVYMTIFFSRWRHLECCDTSISQVSRECCKVSIWVVSIWVLSALRVVGRVIVGFRFECEDFSVCPGDFTVSASCMYSVTANPACSSGFCEILFGPPGM